MKTKNIKRRKRNGIILSKKSKHDKGYRYVKAENSELLKLLYSRSRLVSNWIAGLNFQLNKKGSFVNERINNCEIIIEEREFKGFEGLVILIIDHYKKEIVTSKYIKGVFSCNNDKKGMYDVEFTLKGFDYTIPYDCISGYFDVGFNITYLPVGLKKKENFGFSFMLDKDEKNKTSNVYFGLDGFNHDDSEEFLKSKKYRKNIKSKLKNQYSKFWDEELTFKNSPYLKAFNNLKTKKHEYV